MSISKYEQRTLHVLAQGGAIHFECAENGKITGITCFTRQGHVLTDCTMEVFERLRRRRLIRSRNGCSYRITRAGKLNVRNQPDNR